MAHLRTTLKNISLTITYKLINGSGEFNLCYVILLLYNLSCLCLCVLFLVLFALLGPSIMYFTHLIIYRKTLSRTLYMIFPAFSVYRCNESESPVWLSARRPFVSSELYQIISVLRNVVCGGYTVTLLSLGPCNSWHRCHEVPCPSDSLSFSVWCPRPCSAVLSFIDSRSSARVVFGAGAISHTGHSVSSQHTVWLYSSQAFLCIVL